ncbi:hypothetical protein ABN028_05680 [Actinopolymorpha sp. B17G11]|uniref:hypothetical protein n=1 Tax=Actinopolymorpha sp. B17G11 TaxID=3160861 RepID=UPI0032E39D7D
MIDVSRTRPHCRLLSTSGCIAEKRFGWPRPSTLDPSVVLYSDLDNALRWIEADRIEVERHLEELPADFVVISRTDRAMNGCPRRLRDTEAIVNHIYQLATGRTWDLMFAVRAMSPEAASVVVEHGSEDTIANGVEWPLIVEQGGLGVAYREADGLSYHIRQDFDADADDHDADPIQWVARVEIANLHAQTQENPRRMAAGPSQLTSAVNRPPARYNGMLRLPVAESAAGPPSSTIRQGWPRCRRRVVDSLFDTEPINVPLFQGGW